MSHIFKPQAVIYDMDGILVDSEPLWDEAERFVLPQYGLDRDKTLAKLGIVTTGLRINEVVEMFCHTAPEKMIDPEEMANRIIQEAIRRIIETKPVLPGVVESLQLCQSLGLKIGLASSSAMRVITAVTQLLNIENYFQVRISAEYMPYGKPHPQVYLTAAEQLGVSPLNCITIEDSVAGMVSTKAARMRSIVVPPAENRENPRWCLADIKLNSLLELNAQHLS
ncbi:hexitol phosphatase HxpB [Zophobihabitans entericus]|uniref:Hexitol phosphatase HxpB n=1 Tax=Zophobihabitans entericus TaxID=1635327 RepID=A0A6G9I9N0_9GAMM|nr:hexitol phosphatase HxpB [Zophobihabitans entericus]QIQ20926.1 hexitol phosphatase HxpB [Zophobihabitans entericus]